MASSPALPTQGATEEVTRKREVRLMKNRYEQRGNLCLCMFDLNSDFAVASGMKGSWPKYVLMYSIIGQPRVSAFNKKPDSMIII